MINSLNQIRILQVVAAERGIWEVEVFFALRTDIKTTVKEEIIACSNFVLSHSRLRVC